MTLSTSSIAYNIDNEKKYSIEHFQLTIKAQNKIRIEKKLPFSYFYIEMQYGRPAYF